MSQHNIYVDTLLKASILGNTFVKDAYSMELFLQLQSLESREIMIVFTIFKRSCDIKAPELDLDFLPHFVFFQTQEYFVDFVFAHKFSILSQSLINVSWLPFILHNLNSHGCSDKKTFLQLYLYSLARAYTPGYSSWFSPEITFILLCVMQTLLCLMT